MPHPQQELLSKFTLLAKDIIYNEDRMRKFMQMLGTPEGAVIAVQTVIGAIEQAKPVPPDVVKSLGVNVYLLLVDMAQEITGKKASPDIMKKVIGMIIDGISKSHGPQQAPQNMPPQPTMQPAQQQPQGIINQAVTA